MNESKDNKEIESIHILDKLTIGDVISSVKEVSYDDIEKLTEEVQDFIKRKGFDIYDESEFLTRLEKVLYEGIDKHYD
jgi:hypothetical protein